MRIITRSKLQDICTVISAYYNSVANYMPDPPQLKTRVFAHMCLGELYSL